MMYGIAVADNNNDRAGHPGMYDALRNKRTILMVTITTTTPGMEKYTKLTLVVTIMLRRTAITLNMLS
eukprot:1770494-Lingulodinium_polyedra.AAC.1